MEDIKLNEKYIRKGSLTNEIFVPISIDNNIIKFENGAQATKELFSESFILLTTNGSNINEQKTTTIGSTTELDETQELMNLFTQPINEELMYNNLLSNVKDAPSREEKPTISYDVDENGNKFNSSTATYKEYNEISNDNSVSPVQNDDLEYESPKQYSSRNNRRISINTEPVKPKFDIIGEYEKVKRNSTVPIKIELSIDIPEPMHINIIREMYEDNEIDYVKYIVKKYIFDNIIDNTNTFEDIMVETLNKYIDSKIKKPSRTKSKVKITAKDKVKKVPVKTTTKKTYVKPVNKLSSKKVNETINVKKINDKELSDYYLKLDYMNIFMINDDEQLEVIKKRLELAKEEKNTKLVNHLTELINIYNG